MGPPQDRIMVHDEREDAGVDVDDEELTADEEQDDDRFVQYRMICC